MTDTQLLSILITAGIGVNIWCAIMTRQIIRITNETLLESRVSRDAAIRTLHELQTLKDK